MNEPNASGTPEVDKIEAIQTLFQPVRYRIYEHLHEHGGSYIQEIADALDEDRQLVSHHLMTLAKHGFVEGEYQVSQEPSSKGRAKKVFTLTDKVEEIKSTIENLLD